MSSLTNDFSKFLVKMKEHVPFGVYGKGEVAGLSFIEYQHRFVVCLLTLSLIRFGFLG